MLSKTGSGHLATEQFVNDAVAGGGGGGGGGDGYTQAEVDALLNAKLILIIQKTPQECYD